MADLHSKEIRSNPDSYREAAIKGKNTNPEMLLRRTVRTLAFRGLNDINLKFLHGQGYRYKLHDKSLPGKPDIINQRTLNKDRY